jgi:predicted PurR-regulated permease PerM
MPTQRERVPIRTIAVTIGMVLATAAVLLLGWEVRRVLTWIVVAALLSIILGPVTDLVERRCTCAARWPPCWSSSSAWYC